MSNVEHQIDVNVPVRTAYDQWTQFESFPRFMKGVKKVVQLDDKTLEWTAEIGTVTRMWRAEITDQTPDRRIAWKSTSGPKNGGAVLFEPLDAERTRIRVAIDAEPNDAVEKVGDALGILDRTVKGDVERFPLARRCRIRVTRLRADGQRPGATSSAVVDAIADEASVDASLDAPPVDAIAGWFGSDLSGSLCIVGLTGEPQKGRTARMSAPDQRRSIGVDGDRRPRIRRRDAWPYARANEGANLVSRVPTPTDVALTSIERVDP